MSYFETVATAGRVCEDAMQEERRAVARGDLMEAAYWAEVAENASHIAFNLAQHEFGGRLS